MARIRYISPSFTEESQQAVSALYPPIERGLLGEGLTPIIDARTRRDLLAKTGEEFLESGRGLESFMSRNIPRADIKVREYLKNALMNQFARETESIGREFEFKGFEDIPRAQNLAFGALGSEKGVATSIANMANQSYLRRLNAPDFQSQLMSGLGGAAGMYLAGGFGKTGQTPTRTTGMPRFGESLDPGFSGSQYLGNFSRSDFPTPAPVHYANQFSSSFSR